MSLGPCPSCKKRIAMSANECPKCGHPIDDAAREHMEEQLKKEKTASIGCMSVVGAIVLFIMLASIGSDESGSYDDPCGDDVDAFTYAQILVKRRLKSPTTADFAWMHESSVKSSTCGLWTVHSYVDSENSFGATVRTHYLATVRYEGDDEWALISLETDP